MQVRTCLLETVGAISKNKVDFTAWVVNCGRSVSHHSSFVPVLIRYKLLCKAPQSEGRRSITDVSLQLSSETERYKILAGDADQEEASKKIMQVLRLADDVKEKLSNIDPPTTCTEWCHYLDEMLKAPACQTIQRNSICSIMLQP